MLASITPLGERGRGSLWPVTVTAFALGATAGGAGVGALAGTFGLLLPGPSAALWRWLVLAGALLAAGLYDLRADRAPGPRRQVDERWLDRFRGWVYGLGFGTQLGLAVTTVVTSAATYAALIAAALTGSPLRGALVVGAYGAIRGSTPLLAAGVRTPDSLLAWHRAFVRWERPARQAGVVLLLVAGIGALAGGVL